jgi:uncharacterized membrane protein YccC
MPTASELASQAAKAVAAGTETLDNGNQKSTAFELLLQAMQPDIDQKLCEMICRFFKKLHQAAQRSRSTEYTNE